MSLVEALKAFLVPDNDVRKNAEASIRAMAKQPEVIPQLLLIVNSPNELAAEIRQLAAVLMRKKICSHWRFIDPQVKAETKAALLNIIAVEDSSVVRRSVADVVSSLAGITVADGEWPQLLQFLVQCSQSEQDRHREVALLLFCSLTETISSYLRPHYATLHAIFLRGLKDPSSAAVRVAALKAAGALVDYGETEEEIALFQELVGPILDVARSCLAAGDEPSAVLAFEIFDEILESPSSVLGPSIPAIVQFSLEVTANTSLESATRHQAAQLISWMATFKPKVVVKQGLVGPILAVLVPLLSEAGDGVDEDDEFQVSRFSAQVLDTVAVALPSKHILPPVLDFARAHALNPDARAREASQMALVAIIEGCSELLQKKLPEVLPLVYTGTRDENPRVRAAAFFAIGQLAEHVQPGMSAQHQTVLPAVFGGLNDPAQDVQERAYYALSVFCENLGDDIVAYLDTLMQSLMTTLQTGSHGRQELCINAIGSAASAAEKSFQPYANVVLAAMAPLVQLQQPSELSLRAKAMELVGIVGLSCGREYLQPHVAGFMEAAFQGFSMDDSEVREYGHGFFGQMAQILEQDFAEFLPRVVTLALASCELDDGAVVEVEDEGDVVGGILSDDEDDIEDVDPADTLRHLSVRTGVLDEKAAAVQALGLLALHTKHHFRPYIQKVVEVLEKLSDYFHEDVRLQTILALQHTFTASVESFPSAGQDILSSEALFVYNKCVDIYLNRVKSDDDRETVAQSCTCLANAIKTAGALATRPHVNRICQAVLEVLQGNTDCQVDLTAGDDLLEKKADDVEDEDYGIEELTDAAMELLPALAQVLGAELQPEFSHVFPHILPFARPESSSGSRSMTVACFAEVAKYIGPAVAPYVETMVPILLRELGSDEAANRRNASFCVGLLCQHANQLTVQLYPDLLQALHPLFGASESDNGVKDNAAGAVARMMAANINALPVSHVLPVLLSVLPLKEDEDESECVYGCLANLALAPPPEVAPFLSGIVGVLLAALSSEKTSASVKVGIESSLVQLRALKPELFV